MIFPIQQRFLRAASGSGDSVARHHGAEEWFDDQPAAQRLEDHGDVESGTAEAAVGFAEQRADYAEFGELAARSPG